MLGAMLLGGLLLGVVLTLRLQRARKSDAKEGKERKEGKEGKERKERKEQRRARRSVRCSIWAAHAAQMEHGTCAQVC